MGMICSTIANVNKGKRTKTFAPKDFIPDFTKARKAKEPQSPEALLAIVEQMNAMAGGADLRRKE